MHASVIHMTDFQGGYPMKRLFILLSLTAAGVMPCHAQDAPAATGQMVSLLTSDEGSFEVIYHRVESAGAGAVAAGLIGASIQIGIQSSQDGDKTRQILPMLTDASCGKPLRDALAATLQQSGRFIVDESGAKGNARITIDIDECGLRLVDSAQMQLASYVKLNMQYKPAGGEEAWTEKIQVTGRNRHGFDAFAQQPGLAQSELADTLSRAGGRAANKIIFRN